MIGQQQEKIWTKSFISIALTQFLLFTVFYTLLTTLPIFVINNLQESQSKAGLVVTFMLLSAIMIRPFSAKIIDYFGKKKILVISVLLYTLSTFAYVFVNDFHSLAVVRFIHGVSFGIVTTVGSAIVAEIVPLSRRGEGMGYFAMSMNIAVVIGPFVGHLLIQYIPFQLLFILLTVLMIVSLLFSILVEKEDLIERTVESTKLRLHDLVEMKALPTSFISGLVGFSYGSILSFVPVYAETLELAKVSSYFFLMFAIVMIIFRPYLGRTFDQKGPRVVLIPSLITFAIGLGMLSITKTAFLFLLAAGLIGLGYGSLLPGFQTLAVQKSGTNRSSQAMSTFFTLYDSGIGFGAFVWGLISTNFGFGWMYGISSLIVIITAFISNIYLSKTNTF